MPRTNLIQLILRPFWNMQIRTFHGSKSIGVFLLSDSEYQKGPVCEIWCFYHNLYRLPSKYDTQTHAMLVDRLRRWPNSGPKWVSCLLSQQLYYSDYIRNIFLNACDRPTTIPFLSPHHVWLLHHAYFIVEAYRGAHLTHFNACHRRVIAMIRQLRHRDIEKNFNACIEIFSKCFDAKNKTIGDISSNGDDQSQTFGEVHQGSKCSRHIGDDLNRLV